MRRSRSGSKRVSMYRSVAPRSIRIPVRQTGTYEFTCNAEGYSKCIQLHATQEECDPSDTLFSFFQRYRIIGIKYEFKRYSNVGFDISGSSSTQAMTLGTTSYQEGLVGVPPLPGYIPERASVVLESGGGGGAPIVTTHTMGADSLPTLYWCRPMAAGIVPTSTRKMIEKWPSVSKFEFGTRRKMTLSVSPVVYKRQEVSYGLISGELTPAPDFDFQHSSLRKARSPWFLAQQSGSGTVTEDTNKINHGITYIGCRGSPGTYKFEVTKTVIIEYQGHTVVAPEPIVGSAPPALTGIAAQPTGLAAGLPVS